MLLPWQRTFYHCQKMCLAHLHPKANICAKFHENWWKTEEVVRDARFFPHFCHNMPLPWQHSFCHCRKMCLAHLHSKANISAKFHENWSKTEEVVRDARLATDRRPPDRPTRLATDRPTDDTLIPIYPPLYTTCMRHADSYIPPLYTTCMRGYNKHNFRLNKKSSSFQCKWIQPWVNIWVNVMGNTDWDWFQTTVWLL